MAKLYKEKQITGTEFKRAASIIINNNIEDSPVVTFVEEKAIVIDGQTIQTPCENLVKKITDFTQSIPLLHPETGNVIGTVTFAEIYAALYSAYIFYANERDARLNFVSDNWFKKLVLRIKTMIKNLNKTIISFLTRYKFKS